VSWRCFCEIQRAVRTKCVTGPKAGSVIEPRMSTALHTNHARRRIVCVRSTGSRRGTPEHGVHGQWAKATVDHASPAPGRFTFENSRSRAWPTRPRPKSASGSCASRQALPHDRKQSVRPSDRFALRSDRLPVFSLPEGAWI
jgi:hypothetical protein